MGARRYHRSRVRSHRARLLASAMAGVSLVAISPLRADPGDIFAMSAPAIGAAPPQATAIADGAQRETAGATVRRDWKTKAPIEIAFDPAQAAVQVNGGDMSKVVFLMSVIVHEFVHVEGGPDEGQGYTYQLAFLDAAYKNGLISAREYKAARSMLDQHVSWYLEDKSGGGDQVQAEICGGCLTYDALNPFGFWRQLSAGSQFDTTRAAEVRQ